MLIFVKPRVCVGCSVAQDRVGVGSMGPSVQPYHAVRSCSSPTLVRGNSCWYFELRRSWLVHTIDTIKVLWSHVLHSLKEIKLENVWGGYEKKDHVWGRHKKQDLLRVQWCWGNHWTSEDHGRHQLWFGWKIQFHQDHEAWSVEPLADRCWGKWANLFIHHLRYETCASRVVWYRREQV